MSEDSLASELGPGTPSWMSVVGSADGAGIAATGGGTGVFGGGIGSATDLADLAATDYTELSGGAVVRAAAAAEPTSVQGTTSTDPVGKMSLTERLRAQRAALKAEQRLATERARQQAVLATQPEDPREDETTAAAVPVAKSAPAPPRGGPSRPAAVAHDEAQAPPTSPRGAVKRAAANMAAGVSVGTVDDGVEGDDELGDVAPGRYSTTTQIMSDNDDVLQDTTSSMKSTVPASTRPPAQRSPRRSPQHPTSWDRTDPPQQAPHVNTKPVQPADANAREPKAQSHSTGRLAAGVPARSAPGPAAPVPLAAAAAPPQLAVEAALRSVVHEALSSDDVQSKIRECTMRVIRDGKLAGLEQEDEVLDHLLHEGLLQLVKDRCISNIASHGVATSGKSGTARYHVQRGPNAHSGQNLILTILQGKAFLEFADVSSTDFFADECPTFTLFAFFQGQRLCSAPVPAGCDPFFNHQFVFELPSDVENPYLLEEPIHLVLVQSAPTSHPARSQPELIAVSTLQWQGLLLGHQGQSPAESRVTSIEVMGVGSAVAIPAGVLDVKTQLHHRDAAVPDVAAAKARFDATTDAAMRRDRLFLLYAKQWWKEYVDIRPSHRERAVKIFVPDECGRNRLICLVVTPVQPGRLVDTPLQAARFVALIPHTVARSVGRREAAKVEQWSHPHTILSRGCGDVEDHATLLCGLFLGLGLDAYVCVGTKYARTSTGRRVQGTHTWVATFGASTEVTFWESLTGASWQHPIARTAAHETSTGHRFATVGSMFNHKSFFANVQPSDLLVDCSLDLRSPQDWKAMSRDALQSAGPTIQPLPISLLPNTLNILATADRVESELRAQIAQYRRALGLGITWNTEVSQILVQCLASYEMERSSGVSCNTADFQHNIKRAIPKGHTFKGYPLQFAHADASAIMEECGRDPTAVEVLRARGDHVRHSLHVKIFPYPEDTIALWVMLAVTFRSVL